MDAVVLGVAIAMMLTAFVVSLLGPEPSPTVDRALRAALVLFVFGGAAVLLVHERWWMLAALQAVLYVTTAPFMGGMPLRAWTALCAVNFTALVSMGWPA